MTMKSRVVALALFLLVNASPALAQPAPAETTPDPQALVGDWAGLATHIAARTGATRSRYLLTIEKVEDGKGYL